MVKDIHPAREMIFIDLETTRATFCRIFLDPSDHARTADPAMVSDQQDQQTFAYLFSGILR